MNTTTNTVISADTSNKAIKARCRNIRQSAKRFNDYVHETGLMVMRHTMSFGDCTGAAWLMEALPKSVKREALQQWFETFSPIAVHLDKDGKTMKAHLRKPESKKFNDWNVAGAAEKPWYEMDKALKEDPSLMGFEAFMLDFSKYVERMETKAKDEKATKPEESATILSFAKHLRQAKMDFTAHMVTCADLGDWSVPAGQTGSDTNVVDGPKPATKAA